MREEIGVDGVLPLINNTIYTGHFFEINTCPRRNIHEVAA
jgi:hypothetical protein